MNHDKQLASLFKAHKLEKTFAFVKNPMALSQIVAMPEAGGYHNVNHATAVAGTAILLAKRSGIDPLHLAIAGLFHDAGHQRSATNPDHRNLAGSVIRWANFHTANLRHRSEVDEERVTSLILATHSACAPTENFTEEERIIFDADTLAGLDYGNDEQKLEKYRNGLLSEGYTEAMTPQEFVKLRGIYSKAGTKLAKELDLI